MKTQLHWLMKKPALFLIMIVLVNASAAIAEPIALHQLLQLREEAQPVELGTRGSGALRGTEAVFAPLQDVFAETTESEIFEINMASELRGRARHPLLELLSWTMGSAAKAPEFTSDGPDFEATADSPTVADSRADGDSRTTGAKRAGGDRRPVKLADPRNGAADAPTGKLQKPLTGVEVLMVRTANPFGVSWGTGLDEAGRISNNLKAVATAVRPLEGVLAGGGPAGDSVGNSNNAESHISQGLVLDAWRLFRENPVVSILFLIGVLFVIRAVLT